MRGKSRNQRKLKFPIDDSDDDDICVYVRPYVRKRKRQEEMKKLNWGSEVSG